MAQSKHNRFANNYEVKAIPTNKTLNFVRNLRQLLAIDHDYFLLFTRESRLEREVVLNVTRQSFAVFFTYSLRQRIAVIHKKREGFPWYVE